LLTVPAALDGLLPIVVLIHGGFWRAGYGADLMFPLAADLASRGFAVWNIEYRRVGQRGGGFPGTLTDVALAVDHLAVLAAEYRLDVDRVAVVGHSAGGHLALWANGRRLLRVADPGANPLVQPRLAIGLAAVVDLFTAAGTGLGGDAVQELLGGQPTEAPENYRVAQPNLDVGTVMLIHGSDDTIVPPAQSATETSRRNVTVKVIPGLDHFDMIDTKAPSWTITTDHLQTLT
jgi:acetyl esterase/lipase